MNENDKLYGRGQTDQSEESDDLISAETGKLFINNTHESQEEIYNKSISIETSELFISYPDSQLYITQIQESVSDEERISFKVDSTFVDHEKDNNVAQVKETELFNFSEEEEVTTIVSDNDDNEEEAKLYNQVEEEECKDGYKQEKILQCLEKCKESELQKTELISENIEWSDAIQEFKQFRKYSSNLRVPRKNKICARLIDYSWLNYMSDKVTPYREEFPSILGEIFFLNFIPYLMGTSYYKDFSNKLLIIKENYVKVVKTKLRSSSKEKIVFVIDQSLLEQIRQNTYNLDDLQYGIAKAIGIEPKSLTISYFVDQLKNISTDYSRIKLGRMCEPLIQCEDTSVYETLRSDPLKKQNTQVIVEDEFNENKLVNVCINNFTRGFKWLGGYRNSVTGTVYYNACTQTEPNRLDNSMKYSRVTQTINSKDKAIDVPYSHSTQVWRTDYYIAADTDLIINTGDYHLSDEQKQREQAAIILQKYWRRYNVRKHIIPKLLKQKMNENPSEVNEQQDALSIQTMLEKISLNMIYPYKKSHFLNLYCILAKRNLDLQNKLNLKVKESSKFANIRLIVENTTKELESLKGIESLRQAAKLNKLEKEKKKFLEEPFGPIMKQLPDRDNIYFIEKFENCKPIKELYILYRKQNLSVNQRLEILLLCIQQIEDSDDFEMKEDLQELLTRECILLCSGVPEIYLQGLRKRAEEIFYNFVKSYLMHFMKRDFRQSDIFPIFRCFYCKKYKNSNEFPITIKRRYKICKSCRFIHRTNPLLEDISSAAQHLQLLRTDEYRRGCQNPYLTLIQPSNIYDIMFNIWGARSAINEESLFRDLRLVRWDNREPWAPWNSIVLTSKEAEQHEKVKNVYDYYSDYFCRYVKNKNLMALRKYGKLLVNVENSMRNLWSWLPHNVLKTNAKAMVNASRAIADSFFRPSRRSKLYDKL